MSDESEVIKPPYSTGAEVEALCGALRRVAVLGQITHEIMGDVIGESAISPRGRGIVHKARVRLERDESIVFRAVNSVGLERCDDVGKIGVAKNGVRSVHRKVKRSETVLNAVTIEDLEQANKDQYFLNKTVLSMLKQASGTGFAKALQRRLSGNSENLSTNLLRLFGRSKPKSE